MDLFGGLFPLFVGLEHYTACSATNSMLWASEGTVDNKEEEGNLGTRDRQTPPNFRAKDEAWCVAFPMKMSFHSHAKKSHFHVTDVAPILALLQLKLKTIVKWSIFCHYLQNQNPGCLWGGTSCSVMGFTIRENTS